MAASGIPWPCTQLYTARIAELKLRIRESTIRLLSLVCLSLSLSIAEGNTVSM